MSLALKASSTTKFNALEYKKDFPIFAQKIHGKPLVYLDNAATTQKPKAVLDDIVRFYSEENSNIHRGVHLLSQKATFAYENARSVVQKHLGAAEAKEIIFVRGATEGINLIANTLGRKILKTGDEILLTRMEHHSNIVPWQMIAKATGATIRVAPINQNGEVVIDEFKALMTANTKIVSTCHVSNSLGTVNPIVEMARIAHQHGAFFVVDGAQAVPHMNVNVQTLDCDFYVFSGHKTYAPTGIGALYGRQNLLESIPPFQGGGDMIRSVTFENTTYNDLPNKFEAGTPNIEGAIALGKALQYLKDIGLDRIALYESELVTYATDQLKQLPQVRLIGTAKEKAGVVSFLVEGIHAHDIGTILDQEGIAIRAGHHCTQPVMDFFNVSATARASFSFYNTPSDIDALVDGIRKAIKVFA